MAPGPSRATAGPGKTLSRGSITPLPPFCMSCDREAGGVEREETWGEVSPHHPTRGSGERRKLPQRGLKMDFMHILGQKEAIWNTIFSIFERRRGPPNVAGPGKTFPPFPPSRRDCMALYTGCRGLENKPQILDFYLTLVYRLTIHRVRHSQGCRVRV